MELCWLPPRFSTGLPQPYPEVLCTNKYPAQHCLSLRTARFRIVFGRNNVLLDVWKVKRVKEMRLRAGKDFENPLLYDEHLLVFFLRKITITCESINCLIRCMA